jgi:GNAT superfamily N-acetyltransferase
MTAEEFHAWHDRTVHEYAQEHVNAGSWPEAGAVERAAQEFEQLLPGGLDTANQLFFTGCTSGGESIGLAWLSLVVPGGAPDTAWLFDIQIYENRRGEGLGRALLQAVEAEARRHGVGHLALNVFGRNEAAQRLYVSSGYEVTMQVMRKRLSAD